MFGNFAMGVRNRDDDGRDVAGNRRRDGQCGEGGPVVTDLSVQQGAEKEREFQRLRLFERDERKVRRDGDVILQVAFYKGDAFVEKGELLGGARHEQVEFDD